MKTFGIIILILGWLFSTGGYTMEIYAMMAVGLAFLLWGIHADSKR
jgi:hypothetical protein